MAAGEVVGNITAAGQPPALTRETGPPSPPDVLDLLRNAVSIELTSADVTGAISRGAEMAPLHIGAIVATRCTDTPDDFGPYRKYMADHERVAAARRSRDANKRDRQDTPLNREDAAAVGRYEATLSQVRQYSDGFDEAYQDQAGRKIDRALLGGLYDATDDLDHPAVTAVQGVLARTRDETMRTALIKADRIIRFMVNAALSQETA